MNVWVKEGYNLPLWLGLWMITLSSMATTTERLSLLVEREHLESDGSVFVRVGLGLDLADCFLFARGGILGFNDL